jgi:hypothetical protein
LLEAKPNTNRSLDSINLPDFAPQPNLSESQKMNSSEKMKQDLLAQAHSQAGAREREKREKSAT